MITYPVFLYCDFIGWGGRVLVHGSGADSSATMYNYRARPRVVDNGKSILEVTKRWACSYGRGGGFVCRVPCPYMYMHLHIHYDPDCYVCICIYMRPWPFWLKVRGTENSPPTHIPR